MAFESIEETQKRLAEEYRRVKKERIELFRDATRRPKSQAAENPKRVTIGRITGAIIFIAALSYCIWSLSR
jgi:hypothetical protein